MLKRIAACIVAVVFFIGVTPVFGKDVKGPTPNKKAYEHASDKAKFKRGDGIKKEDVDKTARKAEKTAEKAKKESEKAKREAEREAKIAEKEAKKKQREMEREVKRAQEKLGR